MNEQHRLSARELIELLQDSRQRTLALVADLDDAQMTVPRDEVVNPFLWELGHVAFFYDIFVLQYLEGTPFLMSGAEELYDSFRVQHDDRWQLPLPDRPETRIYMERVLERMVGRLEKAAEKASPNETYCTLLAVLHEDMHGEAFTYMRQYLGYAAPRLESAKPGGLEGAGPWPGDVEIKGGRFALGAAADRAFVFDNEKWAHEVEIPAYKMARAPVTNAEFAEFVEAQGYQRQEFWSYQGWAWRRKVGAHHPIYWCRGEQGWLARHFDRFLPLAAAAPVSNVSFFEAEAWCNWGGRRLPTEAEWEMAAAGRPGSEQKNLYPWGDEPKDSEPANLDSHCLGPVDVAAFGAGDSAAGCRQMLGNVWEWTASDFYPFPGYVVDPPYIQYSAPWFGYRKVLKGGAWATRSRLVNNTHRNFFQPYRRDIFAGFRTCAL